MTPGFAFILQARRENGIEVDEAEAPPLDETGDVRAS